MFLKKYLVLAYVLQNKPRSSDDMDSELTNSIVLTMIVHQYKIRKKGVIAMVQKLSVATAPKTSTFQARINPEIKAEVESIYAKSGLTLTEAFNLFIQQSLNVEGLPFLVTSDSKELLREQAVMKLMSELKKGEDSVKSESDWISQDDIMKEFA